MRILIDKGLKHFYNYVIGKSNIMLTWKYIIVLNIKGKHNFKQFYYISTQKGRTLIQTYRVVPQTKGGNDQYTLNVNV